MIFVWGIVKPQYTHTQTNKQACCSFLGLLCVVLMFYAGVSCSVCQSVKTAFTPRPETTCVWKVSERNSQGRVCKSILLILFKMLIIPSVGISKCIMTSWLSESIGHWFIEMKWVIEWFTHWLTYSFIDTQSDQLRVIHSSTDWFTHWVTDTHWLTHDSLTYCLIHSLSH